MEGTTPKKAISAIEAINNVFVSDARDRVDQLNFDADELPTLISKLHTESDTGKVLIFFSYVEDRMFTLLKQLLRDISSKSEEDKLFGNNSPFGTFANKITLSYHLGWISKRQRDKLHAMRCIRNAFAHGAFACSLSDNNLKGYVNTIQNGSLERLGRIIDALKEARYYENEKDMMILSRPISHQVLFLSSLVFLATDTFVELLAFPAALEQGVSPGSLLNQKEFKPAVIAKIDETRALAVIKSLESGI